MADKFLKGYAGEYGNRTLGHRSCRISLHHRTRWNRTSDNGSGGDNRALSNADIRKYQRPRADPDLFSYLDGNCPLHQGQVLHPEKVSGYDYTHADCRITADRHQPRIGSLNDRVISDYDAITQMYAPPTMEG